MFLNCPEKPLVGSSSLTLLGTCEAISVNLNQLFNERLLLFSHSVVISQGITPWHYGEFELARLPQHSPESSYINYIDRSFIVTF